jgi:predicted O-methyltransferase YrrM
VTTYDESLAIWSDIQDHLPRFVDLVTDMNAKIVVELGVRSGVSTVAWLHGLERTGGHLWSVDLNPAPPIIGGRWTFIQGDDLSPEVLVQLPRLADIVFIDTSHTYDHTRNELAVYEHRVRSGGCIVLHDVDVKSFPEHTTRQPPFPVRRAVEEFAGDRRVDWYSGSYGLAVVWL